MSNLELANLSDEALVALITERGARASRSADSESALEELLNRYYQGIIRMAYLTTRDHTLSLDCAQEALLAISKSVGSFRGGSKFSTWVYTVAQRTIWRTVRKQRKYQERSDSIETVAVGALVANSESEPLVDQEQRVINREGQERILTSIDDLPPQQRQAVLLFYYEDCSHEEIAQRIGCAANTVKAHLFKARASLAKKLGLSEEGSEE